MKNFTLTGIIKKLREEKGSTGEHTVWMIGLAVVALIVIGAIIAFIPGELNTLLTTTFGKITDFFKFV